ncbi:hypothetical protein QBA57_28735 [Streptomyces scabiei]|uniref:hypothetical protein n=1 Tax=Streptomyces scabiei TaxID=1930 RepID=UPI001B32F08A|nr:MULTISPECIES: hypothetical protein [Streptomyces]MBP5883145.1 hypothetical protein [Streptomyces sp. LBUM 1487]MDX2628613.1 hypothetical protein [Streptomyces scabiei]MDX3162721.1 hypothetical protein [Streptomyces scabiei]
MARYFHGGFPGLRPGGLVLPPDTTGTDRTLSAIVAEADGPAYATRKDVVYVTTLRQAARVYAAFYPDGALYQVQPHGGLEPDPDCLEPGISWHCPKAEVLQVVDPVVLFRARTPERWLRLLNRARE